jgi:xylulokinase
MTHAVLGIDLGTTYFKAGLFSERGEILGMGRAVVAAETATPGRFEVPAARFQALLREVTSGALREASLPAEAVRAVSYSSQANSFLLLDRDGLPLTPVILWQDRRVEEMPAGLARLLARPDFLAVTGLDIVSPLMCAAKLLWLRTNEPRAWEHTAAVMTVSDYLTFLVTGERAGDSGTASLLGLWDLSAGRWWTQAFEELGFPAAAFSRLAPPGTVVGRTGGRAEELFGLPRGIPFAVGSLDHHVAAVGSGVGTAASVLESTGTVIACFAESAAYAPRRGCAMGPGVPGAAPYTSLAFHDSGAVVLEWYRNRYAGELSFDELAERAARVPPGSEGLVCLPLADTYPGREGFVSASAAHGHGHFARAIMESIAGELSLLLSRLCGDSFPPRLLSTGGAARSELWLRIKADITGCAMVTAGFPEAACAGAAMLAAAAAGWFATAIEASSAWVRPDRTVLPDPEGRRAYAGWLERYLALRPPGR